MNPALRAIGLALPAFNKPGDYNGWVSQQVLDAILASDEALTWIGSHVEPERLGFRPWRRSAIHEDWYLAPSRQDQGDDNDE